MTWRVHPALHDGFGGSLPGGDVLPHAVSLIPENSETGTPIGTGVGKLCCELLCADVGSLKHVLGKPQGVRSLFCPFLIDECQNFLGKGRLVYGSFVDCVPRACPCKHLSSYSFPAFPIIGRGFPASCCIVPGIHADQKRFIRKLMTNLQAQLPPVPTSTRQQPVP